MARKQLNTTRISRVNRKSEGHKRSWLNKGIKKVLRKESGQLNRMRQRKLQDEGVISKPERKFILKRKGAEVVHEEI